MKPLSEIEALASAAKAETPDWAFVDKFYNADGAFIAAVSPDQVLALCGALRETVAALDRCGDLAHGGAYGKDSTYDAILHTVRVALARARKVIEGE